MSTEHPLIAEFPELRARIHEMKMTDNHFARLFAEYHEVDHELHRIVQEIETPADDYTEALKKKRVHLKDQLYTLLTR